MATADKSAVPGFWQGVRGEISRRRGSPVVKRGHDEPPPLSFQQERLWFAESLSPGAAVHNIRMHHRLVGALDIVSLCRALQEIVNRHEILRTSVRIDDGNARQRIDTLLAVDLTPTDLRGLPEVERKRESERLGKEMTETPFDLKSPPLWRFHLLHVNTREHLLLGVFHHFIFDHWSVGMFQRELVALYSAFTNAAESPLRPLSLQYADYTLWQRQAGPEPDYWRTVFAGRIEPLELPLEPRCEYSAEEGCGGDLSIVLPEQLAGALGKLSEECGVAFFVTLLAGFKALLHSRSRQRDLVICTPVSGRTRPELRHLIGCFNNIIPFRTRISRDPTVKAWLGQVGQTVFESQAHQEVPFQKIAAIPAARGVSLKRTLFALQNTPTRPTEMAGVKIERVGTERSNSDFDLSISIRPEGDSWELAARYRSRLFAEESIARLLQDYLALLTNFVNKPRAKLSEFAGQRSETFLSRLKARWRNRV